MIDKEFDCDWYFGDYNQKVKSFDPSILSNHTYLHVANAGHRIYWTKGLLDLLFSTKYSTYFMLGATWDLNMWLFLFLKMLFFKKKKINLWVHGWYGKEKWYEAFMKKKMYNIADGIFVYGDFAKKELLKLGYSADKVFAIHNSLDYAEQMNIRISLRETNIYKSYFKNDHPTIIFVGRLTAVKKLDMILEAIAELKNRGKIYNVTYIGDGSERPILEHKTQCLGIERQVWFYGECYDEKRNAELIYNADLCVAPGNIGLTAIHVMMFGCPAVTHGDFKWQMPEFEVIKPYKTGLFFERNSVDSLVCKIEEWFNLNGDKRQEIRDFCYKEIDLQWNPEYQIKIIRDHLKICPN